MAIYMYKKIYIRAIQCFASASVHARMDLSSCVCVFSFFSASFIEEKKNSFVGVGRISSVSGVEFFFFLTERIATFDADAGRSPGTNYVKILKKIVSPGFVKRNARWR